MASLRGALGKSFLERNQRVVGAVGIGALLTGTAFALLLSGGVFARTYHVTAVFSDAAGIVPGDKVTVAGLPAGTVKGLHIQNGRVAIDLAVSRGVKLPADSSAQIVIQTLLGRETVSLVAGQSSKALQGGATIPLDRTTTPVNISQLNDVSVNLLQHSDAQALNDLLSEVTKVTSGKGQQVKELVSGLAAITQAVDSRRAQLGDLITALKSLSTTLAGHDQAIVGLIDHLNPVLADLAARQQAIRTLLVATDSASHETANLVSRNRQVLDQTLAGLHDDLTVIDRHQVDLAEAITYLEQGVQGYSSVGYSSGIPNRWANIFVQSLGPAGVDAIIGRCGAVDQLFDKYFGSDCTKAPPGPGQRQGSGGIPGVPPPPGIPLPSPSLPLPSPSLPLPSPSLPLPSPSLPRAPPHGPGGSAPVLLPGNLSDLIRWALLPGQGGPS